MDCESKVVLQELINAINTPSSIDLVLIGVSIVSVIVSGVLTFILIKATTRIGVVQNKIQKRTLHLQKQDKTYMLYVFSYSLKSFSKNILIYICYSFANRNFDLLRSKVAELKEQYGKVFLLSDIILMEPQKTNFQAIEPMLNNIEQFINDFENIVKNSDRSFKIDSSDLNSLDGQIQKMKEAISIFSNGTSTNEQHIQNILYFRGWVMITNLHEYLRKLCDISDIE